MATLYDYYMRDSAQNATIQRTVPIGRESGSTIIEVIAKLHCDFDAHAKYVSFYIPHTVEVVCPEALLLNHVGEIVEKWPDETELFRAMGREKLEARDLVFTGRVYLYSERPAPEPKKSQLLSQAEAQGLSIIFRSTDYVNERNKWEKPHAFISHDSRDKEKIADRLAVELQKLQCYVWYDEFSLKVGDSLRDSIEKGLKDCRKCIFILTPNFLSNGGWSKREYDSIFSREIVEKQNVILPVWHEVSPSDVYKYSPVLADKVGARWADGPERVAQQLMRAIGVV